MLQREPERKSECARRVSNFCLFRGEYKLSFIMDMTVDYARLINDLERQELEASGGVPSPQVAGQLLAIYLLTNDLPNAKLLWKRIPANLKHENPELNAIWGIAKKLWQRDFASIYAALTEFEWPNHLRNVMNCIGAMTRQRVVNLISKGYTSISVADVASYLGLSVDEAVSTIRELEWNYDPTTGFVEPVKPSLPMDEITSNEEQLSKLTEYVAFLEN